MNGEIITDFCEKCRNYTEKKVDLDKNTLTCLSCDAEEHYKASDQYLEKEAAKL